MMMSKLLVSLAKNAMRAHVTGSPWFDPLIATLYVTPMCNLRCGYCAEFGAQRNAAFRGQALSLDEMRRLVEIIADCADVLYVTGGEPTLRPDLAELLAHAKRQGIGYVAMNTNALQLRRHEPVLGALDNLVISIDDLEQGRWDDALAAHPRRITALLDNVRWAASQQRVHRYTLTITSVVTPGRVAAARRVMEFAFGIGAEFSAQHLSEERVPSRALAKDPEFQRFVAELREACAAGRPVSGSEAYFEAFAEGRPPSYTCAPTTAPHIDWLGRLAFPCRELPGHVLVDVLAAGTFRAALAEGARLYGAPPSDCNRCGERCYVELSTLVRRPLSAATEAVRYVWRRRQPGRGAP